MSFLNELKAARKQGRVDAISVKIAKLSLKRRAIKAQQLKLTHKREKLLGQELTATPLFLQPTRPFRAPNPASGKELVDLLAARKASDEANKILAARKGG